jgi:hypothetical protein
LRPAGGIESPKNAAGQRPAHRPARRSFCPAIVCRAIALRRRSFRYRDNLQIMTSCMFCKIEKYTFSKGMSVTTDHDTLSATNQ